MAQKMTDEQWRAFVSHGTRTGKLSTVRADGSPHVTPIWFLLDGDDVVFTTGDQTSKGRAVRHDPRLVLCVDLPEPPYSFVQVQGTAVVSEDLDAMLPIATALGARYMGADRAEEFGRRNAVPGELLVRLTPTKVLAEFAISA
jgi:PPOX class probable F420-dependent enzyme